MTIDLLEREQRRLGGGLGGEHIDRCTRDDTIADGFCQVAFVDDPAAGDVDQSHRRLGLDQQIAIDQTGGLLGLRQVDREEVGLGHRLIQRQQLDAHLSRLVGRHERVVRHDMHAECPRPVGDQLADATEADDRQRLVGQLDTLPP